MRPAVRAPQAKFTTAFARRGLVAEHGISWLLPRLVGPAHALDLLLSARVVLGREAAELGLVNRAVDGDVLDEALHTPRSRQRMLARQHGDDEAAASTPTWSVAPGVGREGQPADGGVLRRRRFRRGRAELPRAPLAAVRAAGELMRTRAVR